MNWRAIKNSKLKTTVDKKTLDKKRKVWTIKKNYENKKNCGKNNYGHKKNYGSKISKQKNDADQKIKKYKIGYECLDVFLSSGLPIFIFLVSAMTLKIDFSHRRSI